MAAIAVVLDHTTAGALYDPKDPFNEAVAAFYVQASGGLGDLAFRPRRGRRTPSSGR
ncbi:hypothetical protein [Streptomyces sp. NPDC015414]|uniref:hypothetical protein n=1 Tax=Streptomyces sp. NPDC015414 TaxID=3364957 RepID=UPI0036FCA165